MTLEEIRAMKKLEVTEEGFRRIQEAHKLFVGLWDDDSFIELWKSIPDDACSALFNAVDKLDDIEQKKEEEVKRMADVVRAKDIKIDTLETKVRDLAEKLIAIYAEEGEDSVKDAAIDALGENEFYATLVEGGYDLNYDDREAIAKLLR